MHLLCRSLSLLLLASYVVSISASGKSWAADNQTPHAETTKQIEKLPLPSSPAAGVKLLEGIFQKLRSMPQLAKFSAGKSMQIAALPRSAGTTDELLSIRPAEKNRLNSLATLPRRSAAQYYDNRLSPEAESRLSKSLKNLADAAGEMQDLTQVAESPHVQSYGPGRSVQLATTKNASRDRDGFVISNQPMITEYRQAKKDYQHNANDAVPQAPGIAGAPSSTEGQESNLQSNAGQFGAAATMAPSQPGLYKYVRQASSESSLADFSKISNKIDIALQPPSVLNGIPMVRLGSSALQAERALKLNSAAIVKQKIGNWTIWSILKQDHREAAVQLYLQRGIVEAIRVFDPNLVGPDIGIRLGDDLATIKQKFGEPTFILAEPAAHQISPEGKNYVYPISQVCFELSRYQGQGAPRIVSMLIFDVKPK